MELIFEETADAILEQKDTLPKLLLDRHFELNPQLKEFYNERRKRLYMEDTVYHLKYLSEAIRTNRPIFFNNYLSWAKVFFASLPVKEEDILKNLELIKDELLKRLDKEESKIASDFLEEGIKVFKTSSPELESYITESNPFKDEAQNYLNDLINGNKSGPFNLIMKLTNEGASIKDIYQNIFQVCQKETGRLWQMSEISVAQEHFITAATQLIMAQLYPYLFKANQKKHKIVVSCVPNELHELGARMLADIFEYEGWGTYYFGANTPVDSLIKAIELYKPDIVAISATMTFHLREVEDIISRLKGTGKFNNVKILVGGYPFLLANDLWKDMGADGFAMDANNAVEFANTLVN